MTRDGHIKTVAWLAVLGLPAERYLTTTDNDDRLVLGLLLQSAVNAVDQLQKNQATHIANALVKARVNV
jgi:hypothetical protein